MQKWLLISLLLFGGKFKLFAEFPDCNKRLQLLSAYTEKKILSPELAERFKALNGRFVFEPPTQKGRDPILIFYVDAKDGVPVIRLNSRSLEVDSMTVEEASLLAHEFNHFETLLSEAQASENILVVWRRVIKDAYFLKRSERKALVKEYQYRTTYASGVNPSKNATNSVMKGNLLLSTWTYPEASALREILNSIESSSDLDQQIQAIDEILKEGLQKVRFLQRFLKPRIEKRVAELKARENSLNALELRELDNHNYSLWSLEQTPLDILFRGAGGIGAYTQLSTHQIEFLKEREKTLTSIP